MHTKPKIGDFVRDEDCMVVGFIIDEGYIYYKGSCVPAYRVQEEDSWVGLIHADQTVIIRRDGISWRRWLWLYRTGKLKA